MGSFYYIHMKQLHTYINKYDEVKESIFDDDDIMDRMDDQIKVIEWLAEHTNHNFKKDEAMRLFNKVIKFNADGSFDLPDSYTTIKEKSYTFTFSSCSSRITSIMASNTTGTPMERMVTRLRISTTRL